MPFAITKRCPDPKTQLTGVSARCPTRTAAGRPNRTTASAVRPGVGRCGPRPLIVVMIVALVLALPICALRLQPLLGAERLPVLQLCTL